MRITVTDRCRIWDIKDLGGVAEVKFSTSRKVKEGSNYDQVQIDNGVAKNGYIADYRSFVRFVGHAYNQLKDIQVGDTITNLVADMSMEPYWDSKTATIAYPKNEKFTVFEFEKYVYEPQNNANYNMDKAPEIIEPAQKNTTVEKAAPIQEPNVPAANAEDECPF